MKKYFLLPILGLFIVACSVDNQELDVTEDPFTSMNAVYEDIEPCGTPTTENFDDYGTITVSNNEDNLFVTVSAAAGSAIANTRLHIADDLADFPTVGQGNLPPGKMDHHVVFDPAAETYTFSFSLEEINNDGCITIASMTSFTNGGTAWAGDNHVKYGNWSYFEYCLQECPGEQEPVCEYNDINNQLCSSQIGNPTLLGFTNYYRNLIFLNTDLTNITGTFDPTIAELLSQYQEAGGIGTFTTNYTFESECGPRTFQLSVEVSDCE